MMKIKLICNYFYNHLITPKIRLIIKLLRIMFTLITLFNGSPDLCAYIDYIVKTELEDPEIATELTEKQKYYLKIGCIAASVIFSIFMIYVLKNYHIHPENIDSNLTEIKPLSSPSNEDIVLLNSENELDNILNSSLDEYEDFRIQYDIRIQSILAEEAIMKSNPFLFSTNTPQENFDEAVRELRAYIEENKLNNNLLKLPKFLELERKVSIAYSILNKGKIE